MAKIAICDHRSAAAVERLASVFEARGHTVIHIFHDDPKKASQELLSGECDVALMDLFFERRDNMKDFREWWGPCILAYTMKRPRPFSVIVYSKYVDSDMRDYLVHELGVDDKCIVPWMVRTHLQLAELIEETSSRLPRR